MTTDRGDRPATSPGRTPVRPATGASILSATAGATHATGAAATDGKGGGVAGDNGGKGHRIGRPRGPRRSRDERRAELLDAAERAIRRVGPQASMDELAAEAGITKPILYSHFGDKAGLAAALTVRVAAELDKALLASLSKVQSPEQVVSSTIDSFCEFVETETELYHFLWYAAMNHPEGSGGGKLLIAGFADQIAFTLGSALRQVGEDSGAAEPWAYAIVGMTLTAGEWWLERRTMTRDDLVAYLTRLLWGGLQGAGFDRLPSGFSAAEGTAASDANVTPLARPAAADS